MTEIQKLNVTCSKSFQLGMPYELYDCSKFGCTFWLKELLRKHYFSITNYNADLNVSVKKKYDGLWLTFSFVIKYMKLNIIFYSILP